MPEPVALSYEVLVSDGVPRKIDLRLPNGDEIVSSPISSTLIYGERDAVLVDPPLTHSQIAQVVEGVARSGKRLAFVYITHGHPDHWFGTATLLEQFEGADTIVYATEGTIRQMCEQLKGKEEGFAKSFPQVPENTPSSPSPCRPKVSGWRARFCARLRPATPTRTTALYSTCPRSASSSPETLSTTACTR